MHDRSTSTQGQRFGVRARVVDTRVIGKPDQFDEDPMKYADWSFKLRSYLGAVDQRYQQELTTTEASSTARLNATLESEGSALCTQMYCILVMTTAGAALDTCHNDGVNEVFEAWRQFVMKWEPKLRTRCVGLLMNVLGTDSETTFQAGGVRETRARLRETINKDRRRRHQDGCDDARDGGRAIQRAPHPEQRQNHKMESNARGDSRDHANTTVHRQSTNANAARSESEEQRQGQRRQGQRQGKGKDVKGKGKGKDAKNESSKKAKNDDQRKCVYCNESSHVKAECRKRLRDLADAEGKPMAATPHPNDATVVVPLQCSLPDEKHTSTFIIAMPCANSETSCESSSEQTVMRPGAGSIALAETKHVRPIAAIPSNETYLTIDTCAGASIFPSGFDQSATDDSTVAPDR